MQSEKDMNEYIEAASFMALFHNILLRGLNTIYPQAPFVKDVDKRDFVGYALCWYDAIDGMYNNLDLLILLLASVLR